MDYIYQHLVNVQYSLGPDPRAKDRAGFNNKRFFTPEKYDKWIFCLKHQKAFLTDTHSLRLLHADTQFRYGYTNIMSNFTDTDIPHILWTNTDSWTLLHTDHTDPEPRICFQNVLPFFGDSNTGAISLLFILQSCKIMDNRELCCSNDKI